MLLENAREFPQNITSTGATFLPFSTGTGIFLPPRANGVVRKWGRTDLTGF